MNKGTYYFPRNRTYQPPVTGSGGGGGGYTHLPTYPGIDLSASDYTMAGEGIYEIVVDGGGTYYMKFPDPTLSNGCLMILINTTGTNIDFASLNQPYLGSNASNITLMGKQEIQKFISIGGKWFSNQH
jgi:hypothetical protein